jgi:sugar-specific transcriptional regulator TrmB
MNLTVEKILEELRKQQREYFSQHDKLEKSDELRQTAMTLGAVKALGAAIEFIENAKKEIVSDRKDFVKELKALIARHDARLIVEYVSNENSDGPYEYISLEAKTPGETVLLAAPRGRSFVYAPTITEEKND